MSDDSLLTPELTPRPIAASTVARGAVESKMSRDASGQKSVQDFSAVLKDISTNLEGLSRPRSKDDKGSPGLCNRSSLGILPPETLANLSMPDSMDASLQFLRMDTSRTAAGADNSENVPPRYFKPRFEIESGILDEDGETDLENFLDANDLKDLEDMYTPSTTDTEGEPATEKLRQADPSPASLQHAAPFAIPPASPASRPPASPATLHSASLSTRPPVSPANLLPTSHATLPSASPASVGYSPAVKQASATTTPPLRRPQLSQHGQPSPLSIVATPPPPPLQHGANAGTPTAAAAGAVCGDLDGRAHYSSRSGANSAKGSGDELAQPLPQSAEKDVFVRPLPPDACPTPRSMMRPKPVIHSPKGLPSSLLVPNQSFTKPANQELTPQLPPRAPTGWGVLMDNSSAQASFNASNHHQSFNGSGFPWEQLLPSQKEMNESNLNDPLDPSFCSGKISARSTSLGPLGSVGDCTRDDNFSDFSKPPSFQGSYCSQYSNMPKSGEEGDDSVFHSGFPPDKEAFSPAFKQSSLGPGFTPQHQAFNPFDATDNQAQEQGQDFQAFQECSFGDQGLEEFLAKEEQECLEKHKFLEEEPMEEPHNVSALSGISDKSIILKTNSLWAGNTSGVNLERLREETRLSRCEYFRHNSSRLGSLEDSIPETERPAFGFVHKIRSPEHKPLPLLEDSLSSSSDRSNRLTYNVDTPPAASAEAASAVDKPDYADADSSGSAPSSKDSTYIQSGDSTETVVSMNKSETFKAEELANRLEALSVQLGSPGGANISYPDVVEDSISQERELEKSLQTMMEGELNLSTISKALSEASMTSDPQHFVNLITSSLKAKIADKAGKKAKAEEHLTRDIEAAKQSTRMDEEVRQKTRGQSTDDTQPCEVNMSAEKKANTQQSRKNMNAAAPLKSRSLNCSPAAGESTELSTTPKSVLLSQSVGKVRRKLSEAKTASQARLMSDPSDKTRLRPGTKSPSPSLARPVKPSSAQTSVSEPPTPRDTPTPTPIAKATSVPNNLEVTRRRRPSGNRHSSPVKTSDKAAKATNTPPDNLENLLESAEVTPSMFVSARKHLHTSTPFHHNLNLSTVVLDNLTRNQSISPFVNPDLSINPVDLDVSTVSPQLYTSLQAFESVAQPSPPVRHATPTAPGAAIEPQINVHQLQLSDNMENKEIFSSHLWNLLVIPVTHNLASDVKVVIKVSQIWIGSLEIPQQYWNNVLVMNTESLCTLGPTGKTIELPFFGKREGAFAINLGLVSPGGFTSSGVLRFRVEEPNLRVLTRNGHTIDFGTVAVNTRTSVPVMLVNAGNAHLKLHLEVVTSGSIFSLAETGTERNTGIEIPGIQPDAKADEGVAREVKVWANLADVPEHTEPRVYSAHLLVKLGDAASQIVLGKIEILVRVCFARLNFLDKPGEFACVSGQKCVQTIHVACEGSSSPFDVEVTAPQVTEGIFIFEKKFKVFPGASRPVRIEFVSKPAAVGRSSKEMEFKISPGSLVYKVGVKTNVYRKPDASLFSENSPGLKLGLMARTEENLDKFPVEADRSLLNWFAVEPGFSEELEVKLRNSAKITVNLNVMIRDSENFRIVSTNGPDVSSKLVFAPMETKLVTLIFSPKVKGDYKGKLVLKPLNIKMGGNFIKASINLFGSGGCSDMRILDVKPVDESSYVTSFDREPPAQHEFRIANNGSSAGFVRLVCTEDTGGDSSQVIISQDSFLLAEGETKSVSISFGAAFEPAAANLAVFFGPEIVRSVYRRARLLPGAARLSSSPALLGVDFNRKIDSEESFAAYHYKGELSPEDVKHFYAKTEKHTIKFDFPEKNAKFGELAVEETLSETRLNATATNCHSPPTTDAVKSQSGLQVIPSSVALDQGAEAIVKVLNLGSQVIHWDLSWPTSQLSCSPPAGQLAPGGQAILLLSAKPDSQIGSQGWKGCVEIFSDHSVDNISVSIKPKASPASQLFANPTNLEFGQVSLGCHERKTLTLHNPSADLVHWKGRLESRVFSLDQATGLLNPGQSVSVPVSFRPNSADRVKATLDLVANPVKGGSKESESKSPVVAVQVNVSGSGNLYQPQAPTAGSGNIYQLQAPTAASSAHQSVKAGSPLMYTFPQPNRAGGGGALFGGVVVTGSSVTAAAVTAAGTKKAKATLSLESENIIFDTLPVGKCQVLKVTIKNRTPESQIVELSLEPGSPFIIIHDTIEVKSQSFSRVPVQFKPTQPGRFGAHLRIRSSTGWNLVATLAGAATIQQHLNASSG